VPYLTTRIYKCNQAQWLQILNDHGCPPSNLTVARGFCIVTWNRRIAFWTQKAGKCRVKRQGEQRRRGLEYCTYIQDKISLKEYYMILYGVLDQYKTLWCYGVFGGHRKHLKTNTPRIQWIQMVCFDGHMAAALEPSWQGTYVLQISDCRRCRNRWLQFGSAVQNLAGWTGWIYYTYQYMIIVIFLQLKCHVNWWFHPTRVISFQDIVAHGISIYSSIHFLWHVLKPHYHWVNQNLYINKFNMYIDNDTSTSLKKWPEANNSLCHSQLWLSSIHPVVFLAVRRTWRNRLSSSPL
jgi:hypothetical protein